MIFSPKPDSHVANPGSVAIFLSVYLTDYELNVSTKFLVSSLELAFLLSFSINLLNVPF